MPTRRVVVTGLGVVSSNGVGLTSFREALQAGRSGIAFHPRLHELNLACQIGGVPPLDEEHILKVLPYSAYHKMTEGMVYAALAGLECARHSGVEIDLLHEYLQSPLDPHSGAVIGTGSGGGMAVVLDRISPVLAAAPTAAPSRGALPLGGDIVTQTMCSSESAALGGLLGLGGQVTTNSSACTTGTEAVFEGYKNILLGYAESMYVGGVEESHYGVWAGFDAMRDVLCSQYNDLPEKASQPMGAGACGFVPGSGAAVLRLESLEYALARSAPILCELVSAYCNSGGQRDGGTMTFPNPDRVVECIRRVLADGGVRADQVSLINGHLTSTIADPLEVANWRRALELPDDRFPWIQSTKSMIGHGLGAAGAIESVAVVDQLVHGYVHPSINCEDVHPKIRVVEHRIPHHTVHAPLDYVLKASFGFGDVNGCLLFRRWNGDDKNLVRN